MRRNLPTSERQSNALKSYGSARKKRPMTKKGENVERRYSTFRWKELEFNLTARSPVRWYELYRGTDDRAENSSLEFNRKEEGGKEGPRRCFPIALRQKGSETQRKMGAGDLGKEGGGGEELREEGAASDGSVERRKNHFGEELCWFPPIPGHAFSVCFFSKKVVAMFWKLWMGLGNYFSQHHLPLKDKYI